MGRGSSWGGGFSSGGIGSGGGRGGGERGAGLGAAGIGARGGPPSTPLGSAWSSSPAPLGRCDGPDLKDMILSACFTKSSISSGTKAGRSLGSLMGPFSPSRL